MAFGANANETMRTISNMAAFISRHEVSALRRILALPTWPAPYPRADTLHSRSAEQANRRISGNGEGGDRGSGNQCDLHSATLLKPKLTIGSPPRGMSSVGSSAAKGFPPQDRRWRQAAKLQAARMQT